MEDNFQIVLLDALTEALTKNKTVTIKNNMNNFIIVITASSSEIIVSVSKLPHMVNDIVTVLSDALNEKPDMIFDRVSVIKENFIIYYMVWIRNVEQGKHFIEREYAVAQNNITYLSPKALSVIEHIN